MSSIIEQKLTRAIDLGTQVGISLQHLRDAPAYNVDALRLRLRNFCRAVTDIAKNTENEMPIPNSTDQKLAAIDDLAAGVVISLRTLRHSPISPDQLRLRLQEFADAVVDAANEIIANRDLV
jgi:hypothetical protein